MLPEEAGNFAAEPDEAAFRQTLLEKVDPAAPTGVSTIRDFTVGPTASEYELTGPCFEG